MSKKLSDLSLEDEATISKNIAYQIVDDSDDPYVTITATSQLQSEGPLLVGQHNVFRTDPAPTWQVALDQGKQAARDALFNRVKAGLFD